jgi:hypothetical protein
MHEQQWLEQEGPPIWQTFVQQTILETQSLMSAWTDQGLTRLSISMQNAKPTIVES